MAKKTPPAKALAKTGRAEVATQSQLPAFMRGKAGQGVEGIRSADVEIPRIQLLQALSPQVEEGFKQGDFYHTVAEESLGNELDLTIVYVNLSYILWRPRNSGGGILARAQDGIHWVPANQEFDVVLDDKKTKVKWKTVGTVAQSGLAEWGSQNPADPASPPAAPKMFNLVVMMPDHPGLSPAVITLQRSAERVAKKLMAKLKISQAPTYGLRFKMSSVKDQNNVGQEFWNYRFTADGLVEDQAAFAAYEAMYERFRAEGIRIRDEEGLQRDDIPGDAGGKPVGEEQAKKFAGKI